MAKIQTLEPAVIGITGKAARTDKVHFKKMYGNTYMVRVDHPYTGPLTAAQKAVNARFTLVNEQVKNLKVEDPDKYQELKRRYSSQRKYKTLHGYIFSKLWDEQLAAEQQGD